MLPTNLRSLAKAMSNQALTKESRFYEVNNGALLFSSGFVVSKIENATSQPDGLYSIETDDPISGYPIATAFIKPRVTPKISIQGETIKDIYKMLIAWASTENGKTALKEDEERNAHDKSVFTRVLMRAYTVCVEINISDYTVLRCFFSASLGKQLFDSDDSPYLLNLYFPNFLNLIRPYAAVPCNSVGISFSGGLSDSGDGSPREIKGPIFLNGQNAAHPITTGVRLKVSDQAMTPKGAIIPMFSQSELLETAK